MLLPASSDSDSHRQPSHPELDPNQFHTFSPPLPSSYLPPYIDIGLSDSALWHDPTTTHYTLCCFFSTSILLDYRFHPLLVLPLSSSSVLSALSDWSPITNDGCKGPLASPFPDHPLDTRIFPTPLSTQPPFSIRPFSHRPRINALPSCARFDRHGSLATSLSVTLGAGAWRPCQASHARRSLTLTSLIHTRRRLATSAIHNASTISSSPETLLPRSFCSDKPHTHQQPEGSPVSHQHRRRG